MTPEERTRMNELCVQIQNEKNYQKFEELMREVNALMAAKESRFPESKFAPAGVGQKILHATATRTLKHPGQDDLVEIHLADAQALYSEIRVENSFIDDRGNTLALHPPAPLDVKLYAPLHRFETKPADEVCAYCKQPITKDDRPAVRMENGNNVHARCWNDNTLKHERKPN